MTLVAGSVGALGTPSNDGEHGIVDLGTDRDRIEMRWKASSGKWLSQPRSAITWRDGWVMAVNDSDVAGAWKYLTDPQGNPGQSGQAAFGWDPLAIRHADAIFAAGLKLQEKIVADFWTWDSGIVYELATVWYEFNDGEQISGLISPAAHLGIVVPSTPTRRILSSTGWTTSAMQASAKNNLLPHLYGRYPTAKSPGGNFVEYLLVQMRWSS